MKSQEKEAVTCQGEVLQAGVTLVPPLSPKTIGDTRKTKGKVAFWRAAKVASTSWDLDCAVAKFFLETRREPTASGRPIG